MTIVNFPFKKVFSSNSFIYPVNMNWSINQFLDNLLPIISNNFNIDVSLIEIVVSNQEHYGTPIELLQSIQHMNVNNRLCSDIFSSYVGFYVRESNIDYTSQFDQCVICLNYIANPISIYCSHILCRNCYNNCLQYRIHNCPICRREF